jgi:acyl phosphate:glycerol-3-phosphate acyltransferase
MTPPGDAHARRPRTSGSPRWLLFATAAGYMLGMVPSAEVAARVVTGGTVDLRSVGSGNPGGMNALRVLGPRAGVAVAVADTAKGVLACLAGRALAGDTGAHAAGIAAVAGHCYPAVAKFQGGMGVATSFGQCVATFPAFAPLDIAIATAATRVPGVRRSAVGSVAVSSTSWILAGVVWWKRRLPNFWGPRPTAMLPLANAATTVLIASRVLASRRHGMPAESTTAE